VIGQTHPARHDSNARVDQPTGEPLLLTEDCACDRRGCDAISKVHIGDPVAEYAGSTHVSPGRITANSDLSFALASRSNGIDIGQVFVKLGGLYLLRKHPGADGRWEDMALTTDRPVTYAGGIAMLPGGTRFLVATQGDDARCSTKGFGVSLFGVDGIDYAARHLSGELAHLDSDLPIAEIVLTASGEQAHLLAVPYSDATSRIGPLVMTVDVATLREIAPRVRLQPVDDVDHSCDWVGMASAHAALSPDERYLVVNRYGRAELQVVDLRTRVARTVRVPMAGIPGTMGLDFSRGAANHGMLAVHGQIRIAVFAWRDGQPTLVSSVAVDPPTTDGSSAPAGDIAWDGAGAHVIAAISTSGPAEFAVWRVANEGRSLARTSLIRVCAIDELNYPNDIFSLNHVLAPPTATASPPPPSATPFPSPTPTATPPPTGTPTRPRPTASPTTPPTAVALPIYLPVALREVCVPAERHVDAVLVVDASSSMLELTAARRPKLDAAREAAGVFLDQLHLAAGDQAAIVAFNSQATLLAPLTGSRSQLDEALGRLAVAEQTRIDLGIETARLELAGPRRRAGNQAVLVVLTDGRANPDGPDAAVDEARQAKQAGAIVYTIGLGEALDEAALAEMAGGGGRFYRAPDAEALAGIYREIAGTIPCPAEAFWGRRLRPVTARRAIGPASAYLAPREAP